MIISKVKNAFRETIVYNIYSFIKYKTYPFMLRSANISMDKPISKATRSELLNGKKVIVSLTSFPERMKLIHKGLYSLMNQEYKPNKIILWLSKEQFPGGEKSDIPKEILELKEYGLEIQWLDGDIRSYKKLIPTLKVYSDDIIVTADDDLYYPRDWLKRLIEEYIKDPHNIHCHLVTRLKVENNRIYSIKRNKKMIDSCEFCNKLLGGSGTLYPPGCLDATVLDENAFLSLAPTSDDIWFWAMAIKKGTKIHWIPSNMKKLYYIETSQENTACLTKINDQGERLFYKHISEIANKYDLFDKLSTEK